MKPTVFVVVISFNDPVKVFIAHLKSGSKRPSTCTSTCTGTKTNTGTNTNTNTRTNTNICTGTNTSTNTNTQAPTNSHKQTLPMIGRAGSLTGKHISIYHISWKTFRRTFSCAKMALSWRVHVLVHPVSARVCYHA